MAWYVQRVPRELLRLGVSNVDWDVLLLDSKARCRIENWLFLCLTSTYNVTLLERVTFFWEYFSFFHILEAHRQYLGLSSARETHVLCWVNPSLLWQFLRLVRWGWFTLNLSAFWQAPWQFLLSSHIVYFRSITDEILEFFMCHQAFFRFFLQLLNILAHHLLLLQLFICWLFPLRILPLVFEAAPNPLLLSTPSTPWARCLDCLLGNPFLRYFRCILLCVQF